MSGSCQGFDDEPCAVRCRAYEEVTRDNLPTCRECGHGKSWHSSPSLRLSSVVNQNTMANSSGGPSGGADKNRDDRPVDIFQRLLNPKTSYEDAQSEALNNFRTSPLKTKTKSGRSAGESSTTASANSKGKGKVRIRTACSFPVLMLIIQPAAHVESPGKSKTGRLASCRTKCHRKNASFEIRC